MREPEVRGLQIRWRGTKITAAATVCNFKDRIQKATAASRLTGSLLQYLLVELLWDRSGYVPLHFGEKETRATHNTALTKKKKSRYWVGVERNRYRCVLCPPRTPVERDFAALFHAVRCMWKPCMRVFVIARENLYSPPRWKRRCWSRLVVVGWSHEKTFVRAALRKYVVIVIRCLVTD